MSYTLTHLGGLHTVTGSCHLLQARGLNIMVDCGLAQGNDDVVPMETWSIPPSRIDYLFLTHAHIDHIGRVPELVQQGFQGQIICTHATKALIRPMLQDALSFSDLTNNQAENLLDTINKLSWGFEYDQSFDLESEIRFKFGRTGHILGSCFIRFEIPNNPSTTHNPVILSRSKDAPRASVVFSGDLGAYHTPILPDPDIPEPCDLLILESTYGDRNHEERKQRIRRLGEALTRALTDGGKILIPAFALGRTQELLYEIDRLFSDPEWQDQFPVIKPKSKTCPERSRRIQNPKSPIPVFIDSPLGQQLTTIYAGLSEFWDTEAQEIFRSGDHPLDFAHLYTVNSYQDHKELLNMNGPAVIIAGSGMCTGGRIIGHLKTGLENSKNDVFFVGYQAHNTPGRDIIHYSQKPDGYVRLDGEKVFIKANVHVLTGYSAHADQKGLLHWVQSMPAKPGEIKLVHGEPEAQNTLRNKLLQLGYTVRETTQPTKPTKKHE